MHCELTGINSYTIAVFNIDTKTLYENILVSGIAAYALILFNLSIFCSNGSELM